MFSCSDESTTPIDGGGSSKAACKLLSVESDGETSSFTWDGDRVTKLTESDSFDTYEILFNYIDGKLDEIIDEDEVYKMIYTNEKVSSIELRYLGEVESLYELTWSGDKLTEVKHYDMQDMKTLYETYVYTWSGDNVSKMVNDYDDDGDGTLESNLTIDVSSYDDKNNPYFGLPLMYLDFENPLSYSKNNGLKATSTYDGIPLNFTQSIQYNSDDYPAKIETTITLFGTTTSTFSYSCN